MWKVEKEGWENNDKKILKMQKRKDRKTKKWQRNK